MASGFIKVDINTILGRCEDCRHCRIQYPNGKKSNGELIDSLPHFCKHYDKTVIEVVNGSFHIAEEAVDCEVR